VSILLDEKSNVLVQGLTGQQARTHVAYMRSYGTNVVAGVSPGRGNGDVDGVPLYPTVHAALREHCADVSILFVPAAHVRDAALEAIEHEIPHVHILAEGVPQHDTSFVLERARVRGVRVIGPNSQGMISPGKAKLGGTGGPDPALLFMPGHVGVISRSGGMGAEISMYLTTHGIGQTTYVSIGGDLLIGTGFASLLEMFEADSETRCIVMFGEAGTGHEEEAARLIRAGKIQKPVVAMIVGEAVERFPKGMSFGHTSSMMERGFSSVTRKRELLADAGVDVARNFFELLQYVQRNLEKGS
jgi:succinyl-CoA synthetase alpha subunit